MTPSPPALLRAWSHDLRAASREIKARGRNVRWVLAVKRALRTKRNALAAATAVEPVGDQPMREEPQPCR